MTIIGKVEYLADIDGRRLPAQARKVGKKLGQDFGESTGDAFESEFDKSLSRIGAVVAKRMTSAGTLSGRNFSEALENVVRRRFSGISDQLAEIFSSKDGIRDFIGGFENAGDGVDDLRGKLSQLREAGELQDWQFAELANSVNKYAAELDVARARSIETSAAQSQMAGTSLQLNRALDELANDKLAKHNAAQMENLRFNVRLTEQFEKYRDSVIANSGAQDVQERTLVAVTKSTDKATSSSDRLNQSLIKQGSSWKSLPHGLRQAIFYTGLFAVLAEDIAILGSAAGSGLTVLAGAAGGMAVGLGTAIAAFQDLTGEISDLPSAIQPAAIAFQSIGDAFGRMQDAIQLTALSNAAGAFDSIRLTVDSLIPAFEVVAGAVGNFIDAFARGLAPGTQGFQNLYKLIEAAGPLVTTLGNALLSFGQGLGNVFVVAIPYVQLFAHWLERVAGEFLAWTNTIEGQTALQEWFDNGVTIFNAITPLITAVAEALNSLVTPETIQDFVDFLGTMTQFTPILGEILGVIGDLNILNIFAELLLAIGLALQPIIPLLSQTATILSEALLTTIVALTPAFVSLIGSIAPILPILAQLAADLLAAVIPAIIPLVDVVVQLVNAVVPLLPSFAELAVILVTHVVSAVIALIPVLIPLISYAVELFGVIAPLMPVFMDLVKLALVPTMVMIQLLAPVVAGLIQIFIQLASPILQATSAFLKSKEGMALVQSATSAVSLATSAMLVVLKGVGPIVSGIAGFFEGVSGAIRGFISMIRSAISAVQDFLSKAGDIGRGIGGAIGIPFATGGTVFGPTRALIGEAGPEAVVPLNRPLAQIDPSVRTLAAFAQGKLGAMGGGGGPGKQVIFNAGAIVVNTVSPDGRLVAESVVDRIAVDAADVI